MLLSPRRWRRCWPRESPRSGPPRLVVKALLTTSKCKGSFRTFWKLVKAHHDFVSENSPSRLATPEGTSQPGENCPTYKAPEHAGGGAAGLESHRGVGRRRAPAPVRTGDNSQRFILVCVVYLMICDSGKVTLRHLRILCPSPCFYLQAKAMIWP